MKGVKGEREGEGREEEVRRLTGRESVSGPRSLTTGAPQDSVLGPFLYSL